MESVTVRELRNDRGEVLERTDPSTLPADSVISAIMLAELSVGRHVARTAKERAARQAHLQAS